MREHEVEKGLLPKGEAGAYDDFRIGGALFARNRRERIGHVREHIEEVALLRVDDLLHLGQSLSREACFVKSLQKASCAYRAHSTKHATRFRF